MKEHVTKVTRKGQITVPLEVRRALGLREGDSVVVTLAEGWATLERRPSIVERTSGSLKSDRPPLSPEQERDEFERGVADEVRRGLGR
ncbi:MAG: AbrB/MazE/SpoVT family DNA-binding domain-containing protein [Chloroflexota bacterium]|nr:AbrB/MazE/SpoVT family DNA-binding domain-containing protein [Chloroflexota bacterium]